MRARAEDRCWALTWLRLPVSSFFTATLLGPGSPRTREVASPSASYTPRELGSDEAHVFLKAMWVWKRLLESLAQLVTITTASRAAG
jgi:hypothetical protein